MRCVSHEEGGTPVLSSALAATFLTDGLWVALRRSLSSLVALKSPVFSDVSIVRFDFFPVASVRTPEEHGASAAEVRLVDGQEMVWAGGRWRAASLLREAPSAEATGMPLGPLEYAESWELNAIFRSIPRRRRMISPRSHICNCEWETRDMMFLAKVLWAGIFETAWCH